MAKIVSCRDVGVDCDFVARGEIGQDILQQCTEHARKDHGMIEIPAEVADKVRGAIATKLLRHCLAKLTGSPFPA